MHDLKPRTALGGAAPRTDRFGHVTIAENDGLALASIAARMGREADCHKTLGARLGSVPAPGRAVFRDPETGFWTGPDQWMISAPAATQELLADDLKAQFEGNASVTEQSGAWVCLDLIGEGMADIMERLCAAPIRKMQAGAAQRTTIHQLGCFVIRQTAPGHLRILGPRASAGTLHHALLTAARSTA